ncbi:hypothetical protein OIU79_008808 [Salix purpurea]|uniref:Uncharacterized protein n=1 Tax=Salix purpurea TaxID=77065 RepID=A0A9Q0TJA2_SALPP|nr:hypothetical protein OIU79_008808 [Salix purpurea]
MLLMRLGNTAWHRDVTRIHSTSHPCLRSEIISCHALRLHSLHAHRHWPRCRSAVNSMSTWHASRNRISRCDRLWRLKTSCSFKICICIYWTCRIIDDLLSRLRGNQGIPSR